MNYQLKKWIPENKLVKEILTLNPINEFEREKKQMKNEFTQFIYLNDFAKKSKDPDMIDFLDINVDKINWNIMLSKNPKGYILGMKYFDMIPIKDKALLCRYVEAFDFVIQQWEKIGNGHKWFYLCQNPKAIDFLEKHQDNIDWYSLSINPGIYEYNYKKDAKIRMNIIRMELMEKTWHPNRCMDWCFSYIL